MSCEGNVLLKIGREGRVPKFMKKKEIYLGGLNCANCARKIEERVQDLEGIVSVNLNFIKKIIKFEVRDDEDIEKIVEKVIEIINATEPGLNIEVLGKKGISKKETSANTGCITGG